MSIRPLPNEVVAQIKSSTAIVSLNEVVLGLLKNSLDAKASKIEATVDFARGGCVVEDDGLGISPAEFSEDGGLGKRYCMYTVCYFTIPANDQGTSKFHSEEPHLGQHGVFLASLSAVSLLTITSHHHANRTQNSVSFHHAQAIERQLPTPVHNHVHGKHGTRITVRNLFGNMPVRVKQRAMVVDQKTEQYRLRNALKRDTVGLLLSWQGSISLKLRGVDGGTIVHVNTSNTAAAESSRNAVTERQRSAHLSSLLQIMTQANYINIGEWGSWVPVAASTPAISVKGAISLEPAPSKHMQFISFGMRPLPSGSVGNELYDQVNRLFALSSFGTVEDDADVDEQEQSRRLTDKRYKNEGYTNRQLKSRKGVDKFPMFHLRVSLKEKTALEVADSQIIENESNLQAVIDVFNAMLTQWLTVHHFRPREAHQGGRSRLVSAVVQGPAEESLIPRKRQASASIPTEPLTSGHVSLATKSRKKQRLDMSSLEKPLQRSRSKAFADWSRIKSGKSSFFQNTSVAHKASSLQSSQYTLPQHEHDRRGPFYNEALQETAALEINSIAKGALGGVSISSPLKFGNHIPCTPSSKDGTIIWIDPSTTKTYHLNARTGCVVPPQRPQTNPAALSPSTTRLNMSTSLGMVARPATAEPAKTMWLDNLLQTWDNPVFKTCEQGIQQLSLHDVQNREAYHNNLDCSHFDLQGSFSDAGSTSTKLSKEALLRAEVISQVDKKFILTRMRGSTDEAGLRADVLVLIDQHAADERVQVETLLRGLCSPARTEEPATQSGATNHSPVVTIILDKPLYFTISPNDLAHFETFSASFAAWGILYNTSGPVSSSGRPGMTGKSTCKLSVMALPPSISERCKADPELLISFLRSAVWKYVESPPLPRSASNDADTNWVRKIATCPPGLVDMINSRACRSAIMFNDELSLEECKTLVSKLAGCVFPFMCAHGRPSMVPIADMVKTRGGDHAAGDGNGTGFVDAWKGWKRP